MSLQSRLAIATRGFRGGFAGGGISQTIYVDEAISAVVDYEQLSVSVESVQAIGADYGPVEVEVEVEEYC